MITIEALSKSFGRRRAPVLDGIALHLEPGERIALLGANGAGKTTLIRCLLGEYAYRGTIRVGGLEPRRQRTAALRQIGFVPQLPPPLKMPVGQLIGFSAALCGSSPARMAAIAARLGLDVCAVRALPFTRLSGGMKQKLLIAIALGRDSRLLILDEPAASLDPEARQTFFALLAERLAETTLILSSHRLDEVSALVNRVVELDTGRIVLDDKVADPAALAERLPCRIVLARFEAAVATALANWRFQAEDDARLIWQGEVAGPDRLRFLGMLARYTGLIHHFTLGASS